MISTQWKDSKHTYNTSTILGWLFCAAADAEQKIKDINMAALYIYGL